MKPVYWAIIVVVVGAGAFFGGLKVGQMGGNRAQAFQNLRNLSPEERQQRLQQFGMNGQLGTNGQGGAGARMGVGTTGDVISKDDKSFTVKLRDGGTRIVFFSPTTQTMKSVDTTATDVQVGTTVIVNGTSNPDGSVTAQTVQIRPTMTATAMPTPTTPVGMMQTPAASMMPIGQ